MNWRGAARRGSPDQMQLAAIVREIMDTEGEALARLAAGEQSALDALLAQTNKVEETADVGELVKRSDELQNKWKVQLKDIWEAGAHRLLCGDSTDLESVYRLMGDDRASVVVTDPPYGVEYDGTHLSSGTYFGQGQRKSEKLAGDDTASIYYLTIPILEKVVSEKAAVFVFFAGAKGFEVYDAVRQSAFEIRSLIIWNKNHAQFGSMGSHYKQKHEPILYLHRKGHPVIWNGATNEVTVWDCSRESKNEWHLTQKPPDLYVRAIQNHSNVGDFAFDGFLGGGSLLVACEQTGRIGRGMEIEPKYCAVTLERLSLLGLQPRRLERVEHGKTKRKTRAA